tara:strand:+ start:123 stop:833 length:711 start_codon:yes stop_codon:yes gene_type:complete
MMVRDSNSSGKKMISTGSVEIDRKMGGGIPFGTLMLVEGAASSGKSSLVQQLLWSALLSGERVALYVTEQTVHSLLSQMASLGLDVVDHFLMDRLRIFPVSVSRNDDPDLGFLSRHMEEQKEYGILAVDSLTTIVPWSGGEQIKDFLSRCKTVCDEGKVVICTAHEDAFEEDISSRTRSVCDAYIRLHVNPAGSSLLKTMEVAKIRGAEMKTGNILGFEVQPNQGLRIIPISLARA